MKYKERPAWLTVLHLIHAKTTPKSVTNETGFDIYLRTSEMANSPKNPDIGLDHSSAQNPPVPLNGDIETQQKREQVNQKQSVYAGLGWLDRLLVLWILLAIIVGILLGNFVNGIGPALQKGKFVGVSVPIGKSRSLFTHFRFEADKNITVKPLVS